MAIRKSQAGLTMVEMIVVVAIFSVVASVLFFNFSDFNTNVSIRNLSQEMALMVRKAQTYATGVHNLDGVSVTNSDVYPAYGMTFSAQTTGVPFGAYAKQFVLFADTAPSGSTNRYYDNGGSCGSPAPGNECVEVFTIGTSDKITSLCTDYGCTDSGTVNVVFRRPNPDADICVVSGGSCSSRSSFLRIVIQSARGQQRTISIWNTGQISVL